MMSFLCVCMCVCVFSCLLPPASCLWSLVCADSDSVRMGGGSWGRVDKPKGAHTQT